MTKVKICGITNHEDAQKAAYYGAWAVGFIFYKKSPRYVSPSKARKLIEALPPFITPVGVFVNQKERAVRDVCKFARIHTVQFSGDESTVYCKRFKDFKIIKAFRINTFFDPGMIQKYKVDAYLFDAYQENVIRADNQENLESDLIPTSEKKQREPEVVFGGTGKTFNWELVKGQKMDKPVILSGGLTPENVKEAVDTIKPYAVDVSSGLEKVPGVKDPRKIRAFFENIYTT